MMIHLLVQINKHRTNSQNCSPDVVAKTLCVCKKTNKIWFTVNGSPNITRNIRCSAFTGLNKAIAACLCYIMCSLTHSIHWCGPGFTVLHYMSVPTLTVCVCKRKIGILQTLPSLSTSLYWLSAHSRSYYLAFSFQLA